MGSFLKKGLRKSKDMDRKKVKSHTKAFYQIMHKISGVAEKLSELDVEITEDNVNEHASKILGRDIDNMEKFLLMGKLSLYEAKSNS